MLFGYERMWVFTFLSAGFVIVMLGSVAFAGIYAVGALGGWRAARRYLRTCTFALLIALAGDCAYAMVSGQLTRFVDRYSLAPLLEMSVLAFMLVASMWIMAVSYTADKRRTAMSSEDHGGAVSDGPDTE